MMLTLPPRAVRTVAPFATTLPPSSTPQRLIMDLFAYLHADRVEVIDFANIVCPTAVRRARPRSTGCGCVRTVLHFTDETSVWAAAGCSCILLG